MKIFKAFLAFFIILPTLSATSVWAGHGGAAGPPGAVVRGGDTINVSGIIYDNHKAPIDEVEVTIRLNGKVVDRVVTAHNGKYVSRFQLKKSEVPTAVIHVEAYKASFKKGSLEFRGSELARSGDHLFISEDITLPRVLGPAFWISTVVFVLAYILIAFELLHRTIAAMLGASLMLVISYTIGTLNPAFHIFSFEAAIASIDMNVIFLLMGMMIIVGILKHTGVFQWCAYMSYRLARGKVFLLAVYLMVFTAFTSAFLDNVTTMLLLTGVAIEICISLSINPLAMLLPLILASNVGGTATLIGDPANIIVGSGSGYGFADFLVHLGPPALLAWFGILGAFLLVFRRFGRAHPHNVEKLLQIDARRAITDPVAAKRMLSVLGVIVVLYLLHQWVGLEPATVSMLGAGLSLVVVRADVRKVLAEVEWSAIVFYGALFVLVGGLEHAGILAFLADIFREFASENVLVAAVTLLWVAGVLSAVIDNVALVVALVPVLRNLAQSGFPPEHMAPLWWSLAIGAVLGGLATPIGSSATVVTIALSERTKTPITSRLWMRVGVPAWAVGLALGTGFVVLAVSTGFYR